MKKKKGGGNEIKAVETSIKSSDQTAIAWLEVAKEGN